MSTEAQKKAHRKYYLSHKEYYREKSKESMRRVYKERKDYKNRCEKVIDKINFYETTEWGIRGYEILETFKHILEYGGDKE